jgi:tetratricopeptide (TPR) repeat protein
VRKTVAQTYDQAERMGAPRALALCYCFGGALDFQTGEWSKSEESLHKAIDLYRQVGSASGESLSLQRLGVLFTAQGKLEEARVLIDDGIVVAERAAMRSHCLTRLHATMLRNRIAAEDTKATRESLEQGLDAARRHGHCVTCNALLLPEAVRAELKEGNIEAAHEHALELEKTADEFGSRAWVAMAGQARGRVLLAQSDIAAFGELERARKTYAEMDQAYDAARCLVDQAQVLRIHPKASGLSERSPEQMDQEAAQIYADLGAAGIEH